MGHWVLLACLRQSLASVYRTVHVQVGAKANYMRIRNGSHISLVPRPETPAGTHCRVWGCGGPEAWAHGERRPRPPTEPLTLAALLPLKSEFWTCTPRRVCSAWRVGGDGAKRQP